MTNTYTIIDPTDSSFGAVGDDSTNDTAAIQSAIDYFYNIDGAIGRGIVQIPPNKSFRIDPTVGLKLRDNVVLRGSGFGSTQLRALNSNPGFLVGRDYSAGGGNARVQYCEVSDLRFVFLGAQTGIDFSYVNRPRAYRNQFTVQSKIGQEWNNSPSAIAAYSYGIKLNSSSLTDCGGQFAILENNLFLFMERGVEVAGGNGHLIRGNEFNTCSTAVNCGTTSVSSLRIKDNLIQYWQSGWRAIDTMQQYGEITGNYFENNVSGALQAILLRSGSGHVKVDHNDYYLYSPASTSKYSDEGTNNAVVL